MWNLRLPRTGLVPVLAVLAAFGLFVTLSPPAAAQAADDLAVRWSQIPGPSIVGHRKPVGVGLAGNGRWITSRAYIGGNSQAGLSGNSATGSRFFGDPDSVKAFNDINFYYSPLTEIDASGTIYALFNQASVSKIAATGIEVYLGTKHLGDGMEAYNASLARDMGVNDDGVLWRIGVVEGPGGYAIEQLKDDRWVRISGAAVRIDVDPKGLPWVVNSLGDIWHWDGSRWQRLSGKARDIAVGSDGVVWIIEAEGPFAGRVSLLHSWDPASGKAVWQTAADLPADMDAVNIAAGRRGEAIASDRRGRLWKSVPDVRDPQQDVDATGMFDLARARDIAVAGPSTVATAQADRVNLDMINGGALSLWFQTGQAAQAGADTTAVDPETLAFLKEGLGANADAALSGLGIVEGNGSEGCLFSHGAQAIVKFSLCLDATLSNLAVTLGRQVVNVPVSGIAGVPQNLLVRTATEGADKDMVLRLWLNGTALGPFFVERPTRVEPDVRTMVRIGADTDGARVFQGRIGSVRVWADAPEATAVLAAHFVQRAASPGLPGYGALVLDAPLTAEQPEIALMPPSFVPNRFWRLDGLDTFRPKLRPRTLGGSRAAEWTFVMPDVYRLRLNPATAPGAPATLTVFRDGEDGYSEATFVQTGRNSYRGVRSPVRKNSYDGSSPDETTDTGPFDLLIEVPKVLQTFNALPEDRTIDVPSLQIGKNRLYPILPYQPNPEKAAVSDSFAFASMAPLAQNNFYGHDITAMSPLPPDRAKAPDTDALEAKIFAMFDPGDERSREYTVQPPVVVPWGVNYYSINQGKVEQSEYMASTTREYQDGFGFSVGTSVEVPEVASFSRNVSFRKDVESMVQQRRTALVSNGWFAFHALVADRSRMALDPGFILAVQDLKAGRKTPREFLEMFGTHYAHAVTYGQRIHFETMVTEEDIADAVSKELKADMEVGVTVKKVKASASAGIELERMQKTAREKMQKTGQASSSGGSLSNSLEEIMVGENPNQIVPVAYDLRPVWQLLSPLYFDDPQIYRDLRGTLQEALYDYAMEEVDTSLISDVNLMPTILRVQLERLVPVATAGSKYYGDVKLVAKRPDGSIYDTKTLWSETKASAVESDPSTKGLRDGFDLSNKFADFVGPDKEISALTFDISYQIRLNDLVDQMEPSSRSLAVTDFSRAGIQTPLISGKICTCLSSCPSGYTADGGSCIKDCPNGFATRGGTCYGSYEAEDTYLAWDMDDCEADWGGPGTCEHLNEAFGTVVPKCKPGFFRVFGTFGICIADCSYFGLDDWGGGNATCVRPETARTSQAMRPGGSCPAGTERSNKSCPSVELEFKAIRLE